MAAAPVRIAGFALACCLSLAPGAAMAQQRDPAYSAARAVGSVGEKPDGYLAALSASAGSIADDINIRRRAAYTDEARQQSVTVDQVAFVAGCRNILRTVAGEKYQAPDGTWHSRDAAAPIRDARCP
jgi:uncharacterized protein YdbL (DUF1318 family)